MGQLLLRVLHPGIVLIELRGILLGGENGGDGDLNDLHILIVEILCFQSGLALDDPVNIGRDDIAQLPQPLPVIGGCQLLFLNSQLSLDALAEIADGFSQALALLPHGVLAVF